MFQLKNVVRDFGRNNVLSKTKEIGTVHRSSRFPEQLYMKVLRKIQLTQEWKPMNPQSRGTSANWALQKKKRKIRIFQE